MLLNGLSWRKIHDKNNLIKIEKNNNAQICHNTEIFKFWDKKKNNRKVDIFNIIKHIYLGTEKIELIKDNYSHNSDTVFNNLKKQGKISIEI